MSSPGQEITRNIVGPPVPSRPSGILHLLYHEITPTETGYGYALSAQEFGKHLALFRQARDAAAGWFWPEVTFDDGHLSNFEEAMPLLAGSDFTARFFITVGWTSARAGYMTWDHLRQIQAAGHHIGAHGWSHALLTHCTDAELETELKKARLVLEDNLSASITSMSLPGGRCDARVLNACAAAGYTRVFTSIPRAETTQDGPLVGRLNVRTGATSAWLGDVLRTETGTLRQLERKQRMKETAQRILGDRLYHRLWAYLNHEDAATHAAA